VSSEGCVVQNRAAEGDRQPGPDRDSLAKTQ